ncbi:MAG: caspase family protein [Desulfobacterales bacterium]
MASDFTDIGNDSIEIFASINYSYTLKIVDLIPWESVMRLLVESSRIWMYFIVFSMLSFLSACSSTQPDKTAPLPGDAVADFPRMTLGDQWVTSSGEGVRNYKIIDVKPDGSFVSEVKNEDGSLTFHRHVDNRYQLTKEVNITTGAIIKIPSPPAQNLNFPLFVGKKWADEYQAIASDNRFKTFKNSYHVTAIETVATQAGSFRAFKIRRNYSATGLTQNRDVYYWYSPDVKFVVKIQHDRDRRSASGYSLHTELLSYQKASAELGTKQAEVAPGPFRKSDNVPPLPEVKKPTPLAEPPSTKGRIVGASWAVIVGISKYKDTRIPSLRYAAADAQYFYDWIVSPQGGKYAPSMVKLLTDADATGANIKHALFDWLTQAIEEDTVTIYFAGHGSPQSPDHPENLFLLPYDTIYDSVPTTGFPMWDIETALKRFIKARKVIVITDACHAGGVGNAFDVARRSGRGMTVVAVSSSLQALSKISDGVCIISASDDNQLSQEGARWGGGHGVFTFNLLKGLQGEADYNRDGTVTLGELIPFLSEQVRRETRNAQTPTVAGRFDPALSIGK